MQGIGRLVHCGWEGKLEAILENIEAKASI